MPERFDQLRGMAVTGLNTMHLIVGRHVNVKTLHDLKGLRVSIGAPGSSTEHITQRMLQGYGITLGQIRAERVPNAELVSRLSNGEIDAAFSGFNVPGAVPIAAMQHGARVIPIDGPVIEEMRTRYPYLKRTLIPSGTYPNQTEPIRTLGVDTLLVCRAEVDDDTVVIRCWTRISRRGLRRRLRTSNGRPRHRFPFTPARHVSTASAS